MTVKQLRAFLAVAQTLSFTQACERLHLSQPALSLAIKGLEDALGGKLLLRSTRSVRLTPKANRYCRWPSICLPSGTTPKNACDSASPCNWAG